MLQKLFERVKETTYVSSSVPRSPDFHKAVLCYKTDASDRGGRGGVKSM